MLRLAVVTSVLLSCAAVAQREAPFTWRSQTLEPKTHEAQMWVTPRYGRTDLGYTQGDLRFQNAVGIAPRVDAMFGFDVDLTAFDVDSRSVEARVSTTWRYTLLDAHEVIGLAALSRFALALDAAQLEVRVVLDKHLGKLWLGLNASAERTQYWSGKSDIDTRFEQSFALAYQVMPSFFAGLEVRAREALQRRTYQGTALSAGPTLSYSGSRWWFSLGVLAQFAADKARADRGNGEPLEVRDNERFVGRVTVGFKTD